MKHAEPTAGEWKADGDLVVAENGDQRTVVARSGELRWTRKSERRANLHLLAASKDLLSALQDAEFHLADLSPDHQALDGIRAAVAKAKGEA